MIITDKNMNEQIPKQNKVEEIVSPEVLSKKVSLLMTKPENTDTKVPLLLLLKNRGLNAKSFKFTLDIDTLRSLYPDMKYWSKAIRNATKKHLLNQKVEVFLITSDKEDKVETDVLNELIELRGKELKSENNPDGTLRKEFPGETVHFRDEHGKEIEYSKNGFHCPRTPKELIGNLNAFGLMDEAMELAK